MSAPTNFQVTGAIVSEKSTVFIHFFLQKSLWYRIWPCCKIGQGQPRVIIWTNYDGQEPPMLHTNFCGNRSTTFGKEDFWRVFTMYGRGGHLRHVTRMPQTNFHSPYPRRLHINLALIGPVVLEKMFENVNGRQTDRRTPDNGYTNY